MIKFDKKTVIQLVILVDVIASVILLLYVMDLFHFYTLNG
jgi:hypothetical protein